MKIDTAFALLQAIPNGLTSRRLYLLSDPSIPENATLTVCADEGGSHDRFGRAKCRAGRCVKIGSFGRKPRYQLWAVWPEQN